MEKLNLFKTKKMKLTKRDFNFLALIENINYSVSRMDDGSELIKVEKKAGGVNHLEIFSDSADGNRFIINVATGTIDNPEKDGLGLIKRWYKLYDKSLTIEEVKEVMTRYGILK